MLGDPRSGHKTFASGYPMLGKPEVVASFTDDLYQVHVDIVGANPTALAEEVLDESTEVDAAVQRVSDADPDPGAPGADFGVSEVESVAKPSPQLQDPGGDRSISGRSIAGGGTVCATAGEQNKRRPSATPIRA